jgi:hypothetical protein
MDIRDFTTKEQIMNYVNEDGKDRRLNVEKLFGEMFTVITDNDEQMEYFFTMFSFVMLDKTGKSSMKSGYEFSHEWCIEEE